MLISSIVVCILIAREVEVSGFFTVNTIFSVPVTLGATDKFASILTLPSITCTTALSELVAGVLYPR